jgi:hypothetical protein
MEEEPQSPHSRGRIHRELKHLAPSPKPQADETNTNTTHTASNHIKPQKTTKNHKKNQKTTKSNNKTQPPSLQGLA